MEFKIEWYVSLLSMILKKNYARNNVLNNIINEMTLDNDRYLNFKSTSIIFINIFYVSRHFLNISEHEIEPH